ncbi:hypothetical protein VTN00DRAFT_9143 [Thermoascus crustaceus]|uniref:uncharacterized protein n=1 Tax=Thermoascus crustaceus TaxID=5088 RepID=UPI0037445155
MKRAPVHWVSPRDDASRLFRVTNLCTSDIYPAILTQAGTGPQFSGFLLNPGRSTTFTVSANWQGRIWGRTNCSFNADGSAPAQAGGIDGSGKACLTGDCGGVVECKGTGQTPATLAEFTLQTDMGLSFYDISLVDGYNLPMGIVSLHGESSDPALAAIPPNTTNPICIGDPNLLAPSDKVTNTTLRGQTYDLPLERRMDQLKVERWCPWPLQLQPPWKPGAGVYPYPDDHIKRPAFDPCFSACSKYNTPSDCCTGKYGSPETCKPSLYSKRAKAVCPDAYSYAYDDHTSTFTIKSGAGFEVVFCPYGRSTTILQTVAEMGYKDLGAAQQKQ